MKVRSGFVSNSSTSSYVILGITDPSREILAKFRELYDAYNENETKTPYIIDHDYGRFVGISLGCVGEGDVVDVSLGEIAKFAPGLAGILGIPMDDLKVMGVEVCS